MQQQALFLRENNSPIDLQNKSMHVTSEVSSAKPSAIVM